MSGVAKKRSDKKKGELIEQNQDGLEVSNLERLHSQFISPILSKFVFNPTSIFLVFIRRRRRKLK